MAAQPASKNSADRKTKTRVFISEIRWWPLGWLLFYRKNRGWETFSIPDHSFRALSFQKQGFPLLLYCQLARICQSLIKQPAKKGGEITVKFVKIFATVAFAAAALSLGACASKPKPAPAPTVGYSK